MFRLGRMTMESFVALAADCVICGRRGGMLDERPARSWPSIPAGRSSAIPSTFALRLQSKR